MSNTLEWYAKRGLLAASDEPEEQNIRRLRLGRRIAKLAMATRRSGDLVASYAPRVGGGGRSHDQLTGVERDIANRELLGGVMRYMPPRSRAAVVKVCIEDQPVGKVHMERLRCGLDVDIK